jgi:Uma2 family endonuclease
MSTLAEELKKQLDLPQILKEINDYWHEEERKRAEFFNLVHENQKAEFINGEIILHSPVKNRHWMAVTKIGARLSIYSDENKLGVVGVEKVLVHCTRNDYEPDVVFFGQEKAKDFKSDQMLHPAPDLVVEVLSESTKENDYGIKFTDYAHHGVAEYWIVDPVNQSVEQYFLKEGAFLLHQKLTESGKIKSKVVVGFEMDVQAMFN